jgi:hypothetical protein
MATVIDLIQNTPYFEVAAQGMIIANQNQSGSFLDMSLTVSQWLTHSRMMYSSR